MIECSLDPKPNPDFAFGAQEKIARLQTYAMETDVFCRSGHAYYPGLAWCNNRARRAVRFFNQHGNMCSDNIPASEAGTTVEGSQDTPVVKWPDRLYDFNGASTPLIYNGN